MNTPENLFREFLTAPPRPPKGPPLKVSEFLKNYIQNISEDCVDGEILRQDLHMVGVIISPCSGKADKTAIITSDGVEFIPAVIFCRGVRVAIAFASEQGDSFIREFHFHKGSTYMKDVETPELDIERIVPIHHEDIWRD